MKDLREKAWGEFVIQDIFSIFTGASIPQKELTQGSTPRITASEHVNGVIGCFAKAAHKNYRELTNFISISFLGGVFYHPYTASLDMKIHAIRIPNIELNRYIGLFLVAALRRSVCYATYGNQLSSSDLPKKKILLPMDSFGNPDYGYMESYMRLHEKKLLKMYVQIIDNKNNANIGGGYSLNSRDWKEFKVSELFKLEQGKAHGLNHLKIDDIVGISYLGATNVNNGVVAFVEYEEDKIQRGNSIAFIRNGEGSMGYAIYKSENFISSSDISVGYNPKINRYIGTFITTIADRVRGKYNFGYKRSGTRLSKETLLLPVNKDGNPDYEFMECYMKNIESQQYKKYLKLIKMN